MMAANWRVAEVRVIEDCAIWVRFADGLEGVVRFPPDFFQGVFAHLSAPGKFREVAVVDGAVTWPGGLDLAPDAMYLDIKRHGERLAGNVVTGAGDRLGFMEGELAVPADFDRMGDGNVENLFSGNVIEHTAGTWQGEQLVREPQGEFEKRQELEIPDLQSTTRVPVSHSKDPDLQKVPQALMRAAEKARQLAEQTGTPFVSRTPAKPAKQGK